MKNENNGPSSMNISLMQQILHDNNTGEDRSFYLSKDFGISSGTNFFKNFSAIRDKGPFILEDYRFGMVLSGEIEANINLICHKIHPGNIVILTKGSIVQLKSVSEDLRVTGMIISKELMAELLSTSVPKILLSPGKSQILECSGQDREFIQGITKTISELVLMDNYPRESLTSLIRAVIWYYDHIYTGTGGDEYATAIDRHMAVFEKFIELANSTTERNLSFYAEKLHLTARYLSSLIDSQSGHTAKYWIDEAIATKARVLLRHSSKSVSQISDELKFPNDSFFCKFFKRLTGVTPTAYRKELT